MLDKDKSFSEPHDYVNADIFEYFVKPQIRRGYDETSSGVAESQTRESNAMCFTDFFLKLMA